MVRDNRSNANSKSIHSKEDKNISIVVADPLAPTKEVLISIQQNDSDNGSSSMENVKLTPARKLRPEKEADFS